MRRINRNKIISNIKNNNFKIKTVSYYNKLNKCVLAYYQFLMNKQAKNLARLLDFNKFAKYLIKLKNARL